MRASAGVTQLGESRSAVMELDGMQWATQKNAVEAGLGRRPGVRSVEANPVAQTVTVVYDPSTTSVETLAGWVNDCGYHCRGESVPDHVCASAGADDAGHDTGSMAGAEDRTGSPADVMGHGGHGEMSMAGMVRDVRNRFLVAVVLGVVITLWSRIGRDVFGFTVPAPFGLRDDVFQLVVSLPVIFYSAQVFFVGAVRALRARTLDMMVLVAVAVGTGWVYSVGVTLTGGG
ncbi:cation transporter, partial [Lapillicoccus sp.]|uniref:cation transporter n=1 Tax=Lapillicoccus sp. TaxID=1909287 RepID=UPI0025F0A663